MKQVKRAIVRGIHAIQVVAATPDGGIDQCGHCGKGKQTNRYNVIQYGFVEDKCIELYQCSLCDGWSYCEYRVEVQITTEGIKYLESVDNGNQ